VSLEPGEILVASGGAPARETLPLIAAANPGQGKAGIGIRGPSGTDPTATAAQG